MSPANAPRLTTDAEGIWRENESGGRFGMAWGDIYRISAYKLDAVTRVIMVVTLDWDFGEFFELMDDWVGFDDAVWAITSRMPGIDPKWIDAARSLAPSEPTIQVWQRP